MILQRLFKSLKRSAAVVMIVVILVLCVSNGIYIRLLNNAEDEYEKITYSLELLIDLSDNISNTIELILKYLTQPTQDIKDIYSEKIADCLDIIDKALSVSETETQYYENIILRNMIISLSETVNKYDEQSDLRLQFIEINRVNIILTERIQQNKIQQIDELEHKQTAMKTRARYQILMLGIFTISAVAFIVIVGFVINKKVMLPVNDLVNYASKISRGQFETPDIKTDSLTELSMLSVSLNKIKYGMKQLIAEIDEKNANDMKLKQQEIKKLQAENAYKDSLMSDMIDKAKEYIRNKFDQEIQLDDMALDLNISKFYLSRLFKKFTGENMSQYITRLRIESSKELLASTSKRIKEISDICGFNDQNYFCKVFKKATGISPTDYRAVNFVKGKQD